MYKNFTENSVDFVTDRLMGLDACDLDDGRCDEVRSTASSCSLATESFNSSSKEGDTSQCSHSPRSFTSDGSSRQSPGAEEDREHPRGTGVSQGQVGPPELSRTLNCRNTNSNTIPIPNGRSSVEQNRRMDRSEQIQTMKYAHLSNEHTRLTEVLDNLLPEQAVAWMRRQLERRDSKMVVALGILFPRQEFPPLERAHCVRCHTSYNPHEDSNCLVPHPSNAVSKVGQDREGATFVCRLCKHQFRLKNADFYDGSTRFYMSGFCYRGKHTPIPDEVTYGGAIYTCQQHGCVEVFL